MTDRFDCVAIGNAIIDVIAKVEDAFLADHGIPKGTMTLVERDRALALYDAMPPAHEVSGGSAANTIAGLAALGARTAYVGKVKQDQLGQIFAHDMRAAGVSYDGPMAADGAEETARSMILVTPDAERSMNTYLGISTGLRPEDIDEALIGRADWLYLEGYLFDTPEAKEAYERAIRAVKRGGGRVALTCSDPFCIERHRDDFRRLISEHVDLVFANRDEALALFETTELRVAAEALSREVEIAAITLSADGAIIRRGKAESRVVPPAVDVVDTTGAGDLFAAGFMAGLVRGHDDEKAGHMGNLAASACIAQIGPRPDVDMKALMARNGL